jgi:hypothetical protein
LDWNASDHKIGILGSYKNIIGGFIDRTPPDGRFEFAGGSANTYDMLGKSFAVQCQSDRPSEESHSNDAYAL